MAPGETPYPAVERLLTGCERRTGNRCWRPRGTPTALIIHTRKGRATARVAGRPEPQAMSAGDTVLWFSGAMQDFSTVDDAEPWQLVWAHFRPRAQWHDWLGWPRLGRGVAWLPAPPLRLRARVEDALLEMDSYASSSLPRATEFAMNALERALLWLDAANPEPAALSEPVQEALLFISQHLDQPLSVRDIAEAAHLSVSRLAHLFKEQIGTSPARFVEQRRMDRAQALLESSSLPIGAVSAAVGFSSQFYFAARFKAHTGRSPSEWRRRTPDW
jgi:AraC family transcriptional regulator, arabinose operon regulatory protein